MSSFQSRLNSLDFNSQLKAVSELLDQAQIETTFWGGRIVTDKRFTGSVGLDELANRVVKAGDYCIDALGNISLEQRVAGLDVVDKLKRLYLLSDKEIQNSSLLTRLLNWIREFSFISYTTRYKIENLTKDCFRAKFYLRP